MGKGTYYKKGGYMCMDWMGKASSCNKTTLNKKEEEEEEGVPMCGV